MQKQEFEKTLRRLCVEQGLKVISVNAMNGDLGIAEANIVVEAADRKETYGRMVLVERAISSHFCASVCAGYYDAAIGYSDVGVGEALLQFDCFPFSLDDEPRLSP